MTLKERIIHPENAFVSRTRRSPVVNAFEAGQMGHTINIGRYNENSAYVRRPVIARVVKFPAWIKYVPNQDTFRKAIRSMVETQSKIDGLQQGLNVEYVEQDVGGAGKKQYDAAKVTQTQSTVNLSLVDKKGRPYQNLLSIWIEYGIGSHETTVPLITTLTDEVIDYLPDLYCMAVLFFEPDPLFKNVERAWLITNMGPRSDGPNEGSRDITASGDTLQLSIEWTGLQQTGLGPMEFAQQELDSMNLSAINPTVRKAFLAEIDPDVKATAGGFGDLANETVKESLV